MVLRHRPCLHRHHLSPDREVFPDEDRAVNCVIPDGWVVSAVHNVYLDFHGSGQGRVAFVLGGGLQLVGLTLEIAREQYTKVTNQVDTQNRQCLTHLSPPKTLATLTQFRRTPCQFLSDKNWPNAPPQSIEPSG